MAKKRKEKEGIGNSLLRWVIWIIMFVQFFFLVNISLVAAVIFFLFGYGLISALTPTDPEKVKEDKQVWDNEIKNMRNIQEENALAYLKNNSLDFGMRNSNMVCPHCHIPGEVFTKQVMNKKGISGAKTTGALLTGGASILATGLSRKEEQTEAHCGNCNNTWTF